MSVYQAKELINSGSLDLQDLLDCLIDLSVNKGYVQATKKFKTRNSNDAILALGEIDFYLTSIRQKIESKING